MLLLDNKREYREFDIVKKFTAGAELFGFEVKSLRKKLGSLAGSYCAVRGGEVFIVNMHIPPYQEKNVQKDYDSNRTRRLLLSKKEIFELLGYESKKGLTIMPLQIYTSGRRLKFDIAVVRRKRSVDRRQKILEKIDRSETKI